MKAVKKIREMLALLWASLYPKKQFQRYKEDVERYNYKTLARMSAMGFIIGAILLLLSMPFFGVLKMTFSYALLTLFFGTIYLLSSTLLKKHKKYVLVWYYILMITVIVLSVYMGTIADPETNATTFLLFLLLFPQFIIDYPWRLIATNAVLTVIFFIAAIHYKTGQILSLDLTNTVVVFCLSAAFVVVTVHRNLNSFSILKAEKDKVTKKDNFINAIPVGVAVYEVRGNQSKQVFTNDEFYRLFEDTPEERTKRNDGNFLNSIHPDDRADLIKAMQSVIYGKNRIVEMCRSIKGDGTYLPVRFAASVAKRGEDYLEVYATYSSMEEEIRSKRESEAKTAFLSRMSHDMRTPMNGILGMAALSETETDIAVLKENMKKVQISGQYLLSLINDTLDIQRIESGKMKLEFQIVSAKEIVDGIVDIMRNHSETKGVKIRFDQGNADLSWHIRADSIHLKQIFVNLLSNAVKFSPVGGTVEVLFHINYREGRISHNEITIHDTGIGLSEDFLRDGIFKPFSQESNQVSTQYVGSGLGLSIAKSLVELMGGKIEVESALGAGTTFRVFLDFERVDTDEAEQQLEKQKQHSKNLSAMLVGKRILLVEDHPLNAEIVKKMLSNARCEVVWAQNGQEALDCFEKSAQNTFDAVLMDIRMPVMDGLEAARRIRAFDRVDVKTVPIIAMTANAYDEDVKKSLAAGMNDHLGKPVDPVILFQKLIETIG